MGGEGCARPAADIGLEYTEKLAQKPGWVPMPVEEIEDEILAVDEERRSAPEE